jgi:hypothetical protein
MKNVESFIQKIKTSESFQNFKKEMMEMSVTGGVDGYQTPNAFSPESGEDKEKFDAQTKDNAEQFGYKVAPKQKRKHSITYKQYATQESVYKQAMSALHEASYKTYKTDETRSVNQKINYSIKEINRAIYEIERVVSHASRLKMEMGVDQRTLWSSSHKRLHKIGERLNRISKRINELGA